MKKDGLDPIRHSLTNHIKPTKENTEVIYNFYQDVSAKQVQKSLKGMIFYNKLLLAPSKIKRYTRVASFGLISMLDYYTTRCVTC